MIFPEISDTRARQNPRLGAGMTTGKLIVLHDYFDENGCISSVFGGFCKKMHFGGHSGRESFYFF
jgi:hypothetical protein